MKMSRYLTTTSKSQPFSRTLIISAAANIIACAVAGMIVVQIAGCFLNLISTKIKYQQFSQKDKNL